MSIRNNECKPIFTPNGFSDLQSKGIRGRPKRTKSPAEYRLVAYFVDDIRPDQSSSRQGTVLSKERKKSNQRSSQKR